MRPMPVLVVPLCVQSAMLNFQLALISSHRLKCPHLVSRHIKLYSLNPTNLPYRK